MPKKPSEFDRTSDEHLDVVCRDLVGIFKEDVLRPVHGYIMEQYKRWGIDANSAEAKEITSVAFFQCLDLQMSRLHLIMSQKDTAKRVTIVTEALYYSATIENKEHTHDRLEKTYNDIALAYGVFGTQISSAGLAWEKGMYHRNGRELGSLLVSQIGDHVGHLSDEMKPYRPR